MPIASRILALALAAAPLTAQQIVPLPLKHPPQPTTSAITAADLMTRLYIYADDSLMGREVGTPYHLKATAYIEREVRRLGLTPAGDGGTFFQNIPVMGAPLAGLARGAVGNTLHGELQWNLTPAPARNVVTILPGSDPKLKGQYVAIGAHNDHIGFDHHPVDHDSLRAFNTIVRPHGADDPPRQATPEEQTRIRQILDSLRKVHTPRRDSIYNGADDDGSGTVSALEIAEAFAKSATGGHRDYHQVTDEPQYIDYQQLGCVANLVHDVALRVANLDDRIVVDHPKPDPHGQCRQ